MEYSRAREGCDRRTTSTIDGDTPHQRSDARQTDDADGDRTCPNAIEGDISEIEQTVSARGTINCNATDTVRTDGGTDVEDLPPFETIESRSALLDHISEALATATEELAISVPAHILEDLEDQLRKTVDRGVLVVVLATGEDALESQRFDGLASVARTWSKDAPVLVTTDRRQAVMAPRSLLEEPSSGDQGLLVNQHQLVSILMGSFYGNYWPIASQIYVADPEPLPQTHTNIRHASVQAALHLESGADVHVRAEGYPVGTEESTVVEGRLVTVRQSILEPVDETFAAIEYVLIIELDDGERLTLGGKGAFVEEFRTHSVTLSSAE